MPRPLRRHPPPDRNDAGAGRSRRGGARARPPAHQAGRQSGTSRTFRRVARGLARQGHAAVNRPLVCVFAGSHGVAARGVSAFPSDVNRQMLETAPAAPRSTRSAPASALIQGVRSRSTCRPATSSKSRRWTRRPGGRQMAFGMEAIAGGTDLLRWRSSTAPRRSRRRSTRRSSAARRSGGSGAARASTRKACAQIAAVEAAVERHRHHLNDPLEVLARLGADVAAIAVILAARLQRIPVILDGYVTTAAAAVLHAIRPAAIDHCTAGHVSAGARGAGDRWTWTWPSACVSAKGPGWPWRPASKPPPRPIGTWACHLRAGAGVGKAGDRRLGGASGQQPLRRIWVRSTVGPPRRGSPERPRPLRCRRGSISGRGAPREDPQAPWRWASRDRRRSPPSRRPATRARTTRERGGLPLPDTGAVVCDRNVLSAARGPALPSRQYARPQGELDGVGQEVEDDPPDGAGIRPQPGQLGIDSRRDGLALGVGLLGQGSAAAPTMSPRRSHSSFSS